MYLSCSSTPIRLARSMINNIIISALAHFKLKIKAKYRFGACVFYSLAIAIHYYFCNIPVSPSPCPP